MARDRSAAGARSRAPISAWGRVWRLVESRRADLNPFDNSDRPDDAFEGAWRRVVQRRALVALLLFCLWGAALQGRLVFLQVIEHDKYSALAASQQQDVIKQDALRGDVRDRHGRLLAYSVDAQSIGLHPRVVKTADRAKTVEALCRALADCTAAERRELDVKLASRKSFEWIRRARAVSPRQVERVAAAKLPGVVTVPDTRRYYPAGDLAAHVLGYVGVDNRGQGGVEYVYDERLQGTSGLAVVKVDALGERVSTEVESAPVPGATIDLTIDLDYQHIVERELRAGVEANRAESATAVLMDPFTGEILALANYPTFNPNNAWEATKSARKDRSTQDVYEPGSTFKIVTASAGIETGAVRPTDMIDTSPGAISIPGRARPISDDHHYGVLSFEDVIVKSSNVGAVKVALRTGADRFASYVSRFGFGEALAPDVIGESRGLWRSTGISDSSLASAAMGYEVSVTPLQMVTAVSAVANGGSLMEPRLVRAVTTATEIQTVAPKVLRRAIESDTAVVLTSIMESVVERGTATRAKVTGFRIAGKTGTAKKITDGRYSDTDRNASFVGFFPSRAPRFALIVLVDTPRAGSGYGGIVAAPIFQRIAEGLVQRAGIAPTIDAPPPVMRRVLGPLPPATRVLGASIPPSAVPAGGAALMPDVRGLSLREASSVLVRAGLRVSLAGQGFVVRQSPEPGQPYRANGTASLRLDRNGQAVTAVGDPP